MRLLVFFACCFLAIALHSISQESREATALEAIKSAYHQGLDQWLAETEVYSTMDLPNPASDETQLHALQAQHHRARMAFKRVEWLAAYYDEGVIKRFINGAPLPTVEKKVPEVRILEPTGLQVLDELVYESPLPTSAFAKTRTELQKATPSVVASLKRRHLEHSDIFAAARYGVIRVFTLGVTGFDTPSGENTLSEAITSLRAIRDGITPLLAVEESLALSTKKNIENAFSSGIQQLQKSDFDTFDRLTFLKTCVNPLYENILIAQTSFGAEFPAEKSIFQKAQNYQSNNLFADNFLNDFYFANQPAEDDWRTQKAALGQRLFFDPQLSKSNNLSCASCHDPKQAFTDSKRKSIGSDGMPLLRNSPSLIGAVYAEKYFADLRETNLARQVRHVIQDSHEFDSDYLTILDKLSADSAYVAAFSRAYPEVQDAYQISTFTFSDALASYVRSLHSHSSPFDQFVRGERAELRADVRKGFNLFMGKAACGTCHFAPTFAGLVPPFYEESESEVLGVPSAWPVTDTTQLDRDMGRYASGQPLDSAPFYGYSFKTPTVRNIARTAPYMHNGAMDSLSHVVAFYNLGGGVGLGYDLPYQTLPFDSLNLTNEEQQALIAFMEALTDEAEYR